MEVFQGTLINSKFLVDIGPVFSVLRCLVCPCVRCGAASWGGLPVEDKE